MENTATRRMWERMNIENVCLLDWIRQGRKRKAEKKQTTIGLPKDADGHDIPLDTKVLYDGDGSARNVEKFEYSIAAGGVWTVFFSHGVFDYRTNEMYLTRPGDMENAAMLTEEREQMGIKLPQDNDGHDIPLNTKVLYDITGHMWYVEKFSYSVITGGKWRVKFVDGICYFHTNSETCLTRSDN